MPHGRSSTQKPGLILADIQLADGSNGIDAVNDFELATNAAKHGAFSDASGAVSVSWEIGNDATGSPQVDLVGRRPMAATITASTTVKEAARNTTHSGAVQPHLAA